MTYFACFLAACLLHSIVGYNKNSVFTQRFTQRFTKTMLWFYDSIFQLGVTVCMMVYAEGVLLGARPQY